MTSYYAVWRTLPIKYILFKITPGISRLCSSQIAFGILVPCPKLIGDQIHTSQIENHKDYCGKTSGLWIQKIVCTGFWYCAVVLLPSQEDIQLEFQVLPQCISFEFSVCWCCGLFSATWIIRLRLRATNVWCIMLVHHTFVCGRSELHLATSAVVKWFGRARLQKFDPTYSAFLMAQVYNMFKVRL